MTIGKRAIGKVGVLAGGPSNERQISLKSGEAVCKALGAEGIETVFIDVRDDLPAALAGRGIDVAFIALHGRFGEDGAAQAILEDLGIPYTGSGPAASKTALDKVASKDVFIKAGIPVPRHAVVSRGESPAQDVRWLGLPVVVKPQFEGSSIGLSVVRDEKDLQRAIDKALEFGDRALIEEFIDGRELTVGILDDEPLPVIEIVPKEKVYDYAAKYADPDTKYLVPAPLDPAITALSRELGRRSHRALGCRCFSRIDMMLAKNGGLFVLEANTIPGMTERSLLPKAAHAAGLSFGALCVTLIENALQR